ncbi:MAG: asparagine synthetase A [Candidatus Bathyarchaeia archaeon]
MDKTVQESMQIAQTTEMPKPLTQLQETEIKRKQCISRVATHTLKYLTGELVSSGFEWLLPVIFSKTTDPLWPDPNASIEKRIEVEVYGKTVIATQSMIVHKMVACSLLNPKLFILSPNIRIEKKERANTGTHLYEFTQLDFEVRNATSRAIRCLVEKLLLGLVNSVKSHLDKELKYLGRQNFLFPKPPFKVYDRRELEKEYGRNWETCFAREICSPAWVTNIPREFYDFEDPKEHTWDNYDLFLPKYGEVLSGSRREWEYSKLVEKMRRDHVKHENYETLLKLAREKRLKPSAGAGIGVERLVSWLTGTKHVGETQLFPKIPGLVYDL